MHFTIEVTKSSLGFVEVDVVGTGRSDEEKKVIIEAAEEAVRLLKLYYGKQDEYKPAN